RARFRRWSPQWRKAPTSAGEPRPEPATGFPGPGSVGSLVDLTARARSKVQTGADQFCRGFSVRPTPSSAPAPKGEPRPGPPAGFPDPLTAGSLVGPKARVRSTIQAESH